MSLKHKLISLMLGAATLFSLAGCTFGKDFGTVATVSGNGKTYEYTAGYYLYYQYSGFTSAVSNLGSGSDTKVGAVLKENLTIDDKEISVLEYIADECEYYLQMHGAIDAWYEAEGLSFDAETVAEIKKQAKSGWDSYMGDLLTPNGISYDTYVALVENYYKEQAIFEKHYGEGTKDILSEKDVDEVLKKDFIRAEVVRFPKVDANNKALSAEAKNEIIDLVKQAVAAIEKGEKTEDVVDKYMPEVLKLSTKDDYTQASDHIAEDYLTTTGSGYPEALITKMMESEKGEAGYHEDTRYVYFWVTGDVMEKDDMYKEQVKESETAAREAAFAEDLEEYMKDFKVTYNSDAVAYYEPKKIKY